MVSKNPVCTFVRSFNTHTKLSSLSFKLFIRLMVYCESLELSTIIIVMFDGDGEMEAVLEVQFFL